MNELKKTELGLIPNEWEVKKLIEISDINPENLPKKTNNETIINYIDIESVSTGKISNIKKILFKFAPSRAKRVITKDDIIISTVRPYLKAIAMINIDSENLVCSTGFAVVRAKNDSLPKYLFQCFLNDNFINQLLSKMAGSNYPAVTSKDIEQAIILFPPIMEQNKIVSILSTVDDLIENTGNLIKSYTLLKKGLLNKFMIDLPNYNKNKIGELIEALKKSNLKAGEALNKGEYCFYLSGQNGLKKINKAIFNEEAIILGTGGVASIHYHSGEFSTSTDCLVLRSKVKSLNVRYIYYYLLKRIEFIDKFGFQGTGLRHLDKKYLYDLEISYPNLENQKNIINILDLTSEKIDLLKNKKEKLDFLKKGLMQQLLTGKIRVKV